MKNKKSILLIFSFLSLLRADSNNLDYTLTHGILSAVDISYTSDYYGLRIGREAMKLKWAGDYTRGVVGIINALENTKIVIGHTNKESDIDEDRTFEDYKKNNEITGFSFLDIQYDIGEHFTFNPFYYNLESIAAWYGSKINFKHNLFNLTAHHAKSREKNESDYNSGSILDLEGKVFLSDFTIYSGYLATGTEIGMGSIDELGKNNPLEEGDSVYEEDADTIYLGVAYELDLFEVNALYGKTEYGENNYIDKEINLEILAHLKNNIKFGTIYTHVNAQNDEDSLRKIKLKLIYYF